MFSRTIWNWCLYCSYLRCCLSNEAAYFFVVREPNLLFSRGQLHAHQGIEIGSHDRIRTCTTNTLNVPPTAIWATWPFFGASGEIRTLMPFGATTSRLCVYQFHHRCWSWEQDSHLRCFQMWRLYRPLSSLLDVIPRSLRDYQAIKEDALAVDCSALMWLCSPIPQCPVVRPSLLYLHRTYSH